MLSVLLLGACAVEPRQPATAPAPVAAAPTGPQSGQPGFGRSYTSRTPPAPASLLGASPGEITRRLGAADLAWREGRHAVMQFVDDDCVIHAFIDGDEESGRVAEVRINGRTGDGDAACHARLGPDLVATN